MPCDTKAYEKDFVKKSTGCPVQVFVGFDFPGLFQFSFAFFLKAKTKKKTKIDEKNIKRITLLARGYLD